MLSPESSRLRQKRLLDILRREHLDAAVIGLPHHVYYFSAYLPNWYHHAVFVLNADGSSWLSTAIPPKNAPAVDRIEVHESAWHATRRQEQPALAAELALEYLKSSSCNRIGIDASCISSQLAMGFDGLLSPLDPHLWQMRRRKDADELALMKSAIRCTDAMYQRARAIIEPGITELRMFNELHAAAVSTADEPMTSLLGNDFTSGGGGGWPRSKRAAVDGEIYILDLGPAVRGYYSDNCRSLAVNHQPTGPQQRAWRDIADSFPLVESLIKPGARGREIFGAVDAHMRSRGRNGMVHHLGHGVGLEPHEYPHLNPRWDDVLMEGEVVTVEPGIYEPDIASGMRIENQYLVTATGVENLTPFPMELA